MRKFCNKTGLSDEELQKIANSPLGSKTKKKAGQVLGFMGAFGFGLADVYVTDAVDKIISRHPEFSKEIENMISRIHKEDYGNISADERDLNGEQRYFAGTSYGVVARYDTKYGVICFEGFDTMSLFFVPEDEPFRRKVSRIQEAICNKRCSLVSQIDTLQKELDQLTSGSRQIWFYNDLYPILEKQCTAAANAMGISPHNMAAIILQHELDAGWVLPNQG